MTHEEIQLVQRSWDRLLPIKEDAAELFYQKLFELDPSLRRLFTGNMEQQGDRLMEVVTAAVNSLQRLEALLPVVRQLGARHGTYGVRDAHYATVGTALLWTLEQGLGDQFTTDVKAAWMNVYDLISRVMRAGQHEPRAA